MRKAWWVAVAIVIAAAGAWVYGALMREENDTARPVRLLAIAEEQSLDLSFSRSGRLITAVPDEGEPIAAGSVVARIEEPGLACACELGWAQNICFASDYPHFDAVYPGAVKKVRDLHRDAPDSLLDDLLGGNALRFYGPRLRRLVDPS